MAEEALFPQVFPFQDLQKRLSEHSDRVNWVDVAKGLGIFLVVFGHALGGLINSGVLPAHGTSSFTIDYIYSFHMPLFFFLSGIFVRSSANRSFRSYFINKISIIAYPYFLWSLIAGILQHFVSNSNNAVSWFDIAKIPYMPIDQYWFLYVIFWMYILVWFLYRFRVSSAIIFLFAIALNVFEISGANIAEWDVLHSLAALLIYFSLGAVIAETAFLTTLSKASWRYLLIISIGSYGLIYLIAISDGLRQPILHLIAAIAGTVATVTLAMVLSRLNGFSFVRIWGIYSLEIFVAHTIFSAGFRIVAQKSLGYQSPLIHLCIGTAIGIYLPILLAITCSKLGFPYLFTANRKRHHLRPNASPAEATQTG